MNNQPLSSGRVVFFYVYDIINLKKAGEIMSKKYPLLFKDSKKEEKEARRQEALTKAKKAKRS